MFHPPRLCLSELATSAESLGSLHWPGIAPPAAGGDSNEGQLTLSEVLHVGLGP